MPPLADQVKYEELLHWQATFLDGNARLPKVPRVKQLSTLFNLQVDFVSMSIGMLVECLENLNYLSVDRDNRTTQ